DDTLLAAHHHALAEGGGQAIALVHVDQACPIDDSRVEQCRDGIDDAGAADPLSRAIADGVEPEAPALEAHTIDGPERRPHPVPDLRALQGRAGRSRARPEMVARAKQDLAVRPDVDRDPTLRRVSDAGAQADRHRVGPDEACHEWQEADTR